jgi:hypothetical protein
LNHEKVASLDLSQFCKIVQNVCKFEPDQPFTIKWVDEEGDPCTLGSQMEFEEALRLYYLNKESELVIHVFPNKPQKPGLPCTGEDRSIYRRGARRWRKIYLVNGHKYQAKRFARTALCKVCQDRIWGLGRQGYKCLGCKVMVHKRCHKFIKSDCGQNHVHHAPLIVNPSFNNPIFEANEAVNTTSNQKIDNDNKNNNNSYVNSGLNAITKLDDAENNIKRQDVNFQSGGRNFKSTNFDREDENNFLRYSYR